MSKQSMPRCAICSRGSHATRALRRSDGGMADPVHAYGVEDGRSRLRPHALNGSPWCASRPPAEPSWNTGTERFRGPERNKFMVTLFCRRPLSRDDESGRNE